MRRVIVIIIAVLLMLAVPIWADSGQSGGFWNSVLSGPIWFALGLLVGLLGAKVIKPWLGEHPEWAVAAQGIAYIADDITDWARAKYPENEIIRHIDELVDKLIESSGLQDVDDLRKRREIAERAITASLVRKGIMPESSPS